MRRRKPWWIETTGDLASESIIRLKSRRGKVGESWIARDLVTLLEDAGEKGRLQRALKCGRDGNCSNLKIKPGRFMIGVACNGHVIREVWLRFKEFEPEKWDHLVTTIASDVILAGSLISGDFTPHFYDVLKAGKISLIPEKFNDIRIYCNCGDSEKPCIHGAVAWYHLAEAIDEDPWHLLTLYGLCRDEIISRVIAFHEIHQIHPRDIARDFTRTDPDTLIPVPLSINPGGFFLMNGDADPFPESSIENADINPISLLGPAPFRLCGKNLAEYIQALYPNIQNYAKDFGREE